MLTIATGPTMVGSEQVVMAGGRVEWVGTNVGTVEQHKDKTQQGLVGNSRRNTDHRGGQKLSFCKLLIHGANTDDNPCHQDPQMY